MKRELPLDFASLDERTRTIRRLHFEARPQAVAHAETWLSLIADAIDALETRYGNSRTDQQAASILLSVHGANTFWAGVNLSFDGYFDTAPYLIRPLFETASTLYAASIDSSAANGVLRGQYEASKARKWALKHLRATERNDEADQLNKRWQEESSLVNRFAHTGPHHMSATAAVVGTSVTPLFLQRMDPKELGRYLAAFLDRADALCVMMATALRDDLPSAWIERLQAERPILHAWFTQALA